jgi:UPF0755 protein
MTDTRDEPFPITSAGGDESDDDGIDGDGSIQWGETVNRREQRALSSRRRRWPAVLVTLALLLLLALAVAAFWVSRQIDPPGDPGPRVQLTIPEGTGTSGIADLLAAEDVITNATVFTAYVRFQDSGSWQAGLYRLRENSSFDDVIAVLDAGPREPPFDEVTIPEGYSVFASGGIPAPGTLVQRIADPQDGVGRFSQQQIMRLLLSGSLRSRYQPEGVNNLEGFLFPDTYRVERDQNARALLTNMVERFDEIATEAGIGEATERISQATGGEVELTPYEAIIVASLIERESQVPEERAKVARVIYNRLAQGMPLGIDASLNYALGRPATTQSQLATDSPYNLREVAGLPPTPIAVPGRAALEAAVAPVPGDWLYYVLADESGRHTFTDTYEEFLDAKAECQAAGLC